MVFGEKSRLILIDIPILNQNDRSRSVLFHNFLENGRTAVTFFG